MRSAERTYHLSLAGLAALAFLACVLAFPALAQDEEAVFKRAKADYKWLMSHPKAKAVYHNWQTLIDRFGRVYTANPAGPLAPASLYWMGRIRKGAYEQFGRKDDMHQAIDAYRRVVRHFPKSRLADDAQYQIGHMLEKAGKSQDAYLEYLRVTVNHPKGDMVPHAKKRLDALESELSGVPRGKPATAGPKPPLKPAPADGSLAVLNSLRHWSTPTYTRVVLTMERPVPYKTALLKKDSRANRPRRLYLDLSGARLSKKARDNVPIKDGLLQRARAGQYTKDTVRVVLDIKHLASYKVFTLDNPFRVVVDCFGTMSKRASSTKKRTTKHKVPRGRAKQQPPEMSLAKALGLGVKRVVIDPGHGGKDPGAMWRGLKEKDIVLDVAKKVAPRLKKLLGCEVLLTRTRDRFLPLEDRTAFANTKDADLFISLHVNAAPSHKLSGVETYFLNLASDEESMRVAARENATTKRSISDLQVILNDLMLNSKINESNRLARVLHKELLGKLRKTYRTRDLRVKQAPFYVLIGARMPAVLMEVGFITNPTENRRLASPRYRSSIADGIARGIAGYARQLKSTSSLGLKPSS